jgi:hypothetical protein
MKVKKAKGKDPVTAFMEFWKNPDLRKKFMAGKLWIHWNGEKVEYGEGEPKLTGIIRCDVPIEGLKF